MKQLFILFIFTMNFLAQAELVWQTKKVNLKSKLGQKIVKVSFVVSNPTSTDVKITSGKVSCDCMYLTSKFPLIVKAGQKANLDAEYDTTGKLGLNRGRIMLNVAGKKETLLVEIEIPTDVTISPRFLIWKAGSRNLKAVNVQINPDWQGSIDKVSL